MRFDIGDEVIVCERRAKLIAKPIAGVWEIDPPVMAQKFWSESQIKFAPVRRWVKQSAFWECPYCQALSQSPMDFQHKSGCRAL